MNLSFLLYSIYIVYTGKKKNIAAMVSTTDPYPKGLNARLPVINKNG